MGIIFLVLFELVVGYGLMRRSWLARIGMGLVCVTLLVALYQRIFGIPAWPYQTEGQRLVLATGGFSMFLGIGCVGLALMLSGFRDRSPNVPPRS